MSMLLIYDYDLNEQERHELSEAIRLQVCRRAGIDPARLTYRVVEVSGYQFDNNIPYFRANTAQVTLDGHNFGPEALFEPRVRWWCQQVMMSERRTPDPTRHRVRDVIHSTPHPILVEQIRSQLPQEAPCPISNPKSLWTANSSRESTTSDSEPARSSISSATRLRWAPIVTSASICSNTSSWCSNMR